MIFDLHRFVVKSALLGLFATLLLTACGGGGTSGSNPPPPPPTSNVAITMSCPPQIQIGVASPSTYVCTATVTGSTNIGYSLAMTGSGDTNRATLDPATGILKPSDINTGKITVTATANADSTKTAIATVKVVDWILTTIPSGYLGYIGIMNSDGTGATELFLNHYTGTNTVCDSISWRPDHLAFLCDEGGPWGDGYVIDIYKTDGTAAGTTKVNSIGTPPTSGGACTGGTCLVVGAIDPHFSPDGQRIVYGAGAGGGMPVWTVDVSGKNAQVLVYSPPPSMHADWPDYFTPDGKRITFWNPADQAVWIVNSDGTNPHQLIAPGSHLPAIFSPDGTALYYNGTDGVYVAKPDGSSPVKILAGNMGPGTSSGYELVGISPNGKSILLSNLQPLGGGQYNVDLWTADAVTGANAQKILQGAGDGSWWY